jgi:hypothetical protein
MNLYSSCRAIAIQYIHVRDGKPRTVYDLQFVLDFLGEYSTIRHEPRAIQYNTYGKLRKVQYDTIGTASDRPTIQYLHVQQTPHSTYDPRFILYFLGEYNMVRYGTIRNNAGCETERFYLRSARFSSTPRGFSWYDPRFVLYFLRA